MATFDYSEPALFSDFLDTVLTKCGQKWMNK
jgi:hypothetical protein